jgi:hypothetical protein
LNKIVLIGVILVLTLTVLGASHVVPEAHASTRGDICRYSALYFDVGTSEIYGIIKDGSLTGGVQGGVDWLQNGVNSGNWGLLNPYNCPP